MGNRQIDVIKGKYYKVYSENAEKLNNLREKVAKSEKWFKEVQKSGDEWLVAKAKADLLTDQKELQEEGDRLHKATQLEVAKLETQLKEILENLYKPNGKDIDEDTMKLLNSGIKLSETELSNLVNQYGNNPTMIRAINGYCESHNITNSSVMAMNSSALGYGKEALKEFETCKGLVDKLFNPQEKFWSAPKVYNKVIGQFKDLDNILDESENNEDVEMETERENTTPPLFTSAMN